MKSVFGAVGHKADNWPSRRELVLMCNAPSALPDPVGAFFSQFVMLNRCRVERESDLSDWLFFLTDEHFSTLWNLNRVLLGV